MVRMILANSTVIEDNALENYLPVEGDFVVSSQIYLDWDSLKTNQMSKTNNLICSFSTLNDI
jgi:hypothetical protein